MLTFVLVAQSLVSGRDGNRGGGSGEMENKNQNNNDNNKNNNNDNNNNNNSSNSNSSNDNNNNNEHNNSNNSPLVAYDVERWSGEVWEQYPVRRLQRRRSLRPLRRLVGVLGQTWRRDFTVSQKIDY